MASEVHVLTEQPRQPQCDFEFTTPSYLRAGGVKDDCPPELEYFKHVDQLIIKQVKELLEIITGFETLNKYRVYNSMGQQVFFIQEESSCCWRYWCGEGRKFTMHITDNTNKEIMRLRRPFTCACCCCVGCCDVCDMSIYVECPPGNVIGELKLDRFCCEVSFGLNDGRHGRFGTVTGTCCPCTCSDIPYLIRTPDKAQVIGQTTKMWVGCCAETFTDADSFNVSFPKDMDPKAKAIMFASSIFIDFLIFEREKRNQYG